MSSPVVTPPAQPKDPWLDEQFAPLDLRGQSLVSELTDGQPILDEDEVPVDPGAAAVAAGQPPTAPPATPEPELIQNEDGSSITIEKSSKGWKAILEAGNGAQPEVFFGKTKDEMWQNVAVGKINATRKIRELNRRTKLGIGDVGAPAQPAAPAPAPVAQRHELTADEIFEIKTDLAANPALAFDKIFQKRYGMNPDQLVQMANEGRRARLELEAEATSRQFLEDHPDFAEVAQRRDEISNGNYEAVVAYLSKNYLRRPLSSFAPNPARQESAADVAVNTLAESGFWTPVKLHEAYVELKEAGLLDLEVSQPEPAPPAPAPQPAPTTAQPAAPTTQAGGQQRIAGVTRRPRAGLGIRPSTTTTVAQEPTSDQPLSAEQLEDLSDEQISQLLAGVRRIKLGTAGRVPTR